jgi:hypothetical protein
VTIRYDGRANPIRIIGQSRAFSLPAPAGPRLFLAYK